MSMVETLLNLNERKGKLKHKFKTLTANDLEFKESKKEEMLLKLQTKLGISKDELLDIIKTL